MSAHSLFLPLGQGLLWPVGTLHTAPVPMPRVMGVCGLRGSSKPVQCVSVLCWALGYFSFGLDLPLRSHERIMDYPSTIHCCAVVVDGRLRQSLDSNCRGSPSSVRPVCHQWCNCNRSSRHSDLSWGWEGAYSWECSSSLETLPSSTHPYSPQGTTPAHRHKPPIPILPNPSGELC